MTYPEAVKQLVDSLNEDVLWLHGRWIIYRQLFGTNEQRVDLMNESAGTVTWVLQSLLLDDVQIALCRIGDRADARSSTLTLRWLQHTIRTSGECALADSLEPLLAAFESSCGKVRKRRNKLIAHSDLKTKLAQKGAEALVGPSRAEIEAALLALRKVMDCVLRFYTEGVCSYEHFVLTGDGDSLLINLARAKRYRELVKEGVIPVTDYRSRFPRGL